MAIPSWVKMYIILPLMLPVIIAIYFVFIAIWLLLTVTCIGPTINLYFSRRDQRKFLNRDVLQRNDPDLQFVSSRGHRLAVRFSRPSSTVSAAQPFPICIPNGMAATMAMIGCLHDALVEKGFTVLSYDRFGSGFSDPNFTGKSPTVEETIEDMEAVMTAVLPKHQQWILIGPSMGSIVGQCYVATHPDKVVGFLNLDGLPYPFHKKTSLFTTYGNIYWMESKMVWTGLFRPFIFLARKALAKFASARFPVEVLAAQANEASFYGNVHLEMKLMMDCCAFADAAWGPHSVFALGPDALLALIRAPPTRAGDEDDRGVWTDIPDYETAKPGAPPPPIFPAAAAAAAAAATTPLAAAWGRMAVRVISARCYDFPLPFSEYLYDRDMRDWAAAEHAKHALLAADGGRDVFPRRTHMSIFFARGTAVANALQIAAALEGLRRAGRLPAPRAAAAAAAASASASASAAAAAAAAPAAAEVDSEDRGRGPDASKKHR